MPVEKPYETGGTVLDPNRVGDTYVLIWKEVVDFAMNTVHRQLPPCYVQVPTSGGEFCRARAHCSILVDCAGESDSVMLCGAHYLVLFKEGKVSMGDYGRTRRPISAFERVVRLGQLPHPSDFRDGVGPARWLLVLSQEALACWSDGSQGTWDTKNNSQTFARKFAAHLGLSWPEELPVPSGEEPYVLPRDFFASLGKASALALNCAQG
jgi:hypothetical protein